LLAAAASGAEPLHKSRTMPSIDELFEILRCVGERQYGREAVSQLEHALQCATLAEREAAGPAQVTAALLHDIGHLVDGQSAPASDAEADGDMRHEECAARYLARFGCYRTDSPARSRQAVSGGDRSGVSRDVVAGLCAQSRAAGRRHECR
jgi:predicted HD phosphohydrolase